MNDLLTVAHAAGEMNMDDTRLIAETCKLEQVWRWCQDDCHLEMEPQSLDDGSYSRIWAYEWQEYDDCPTCDGTGKVAFIDASNILFVIQWARRQAWWIEVLSPMNHLFAMFCTRTINLEKFVAESVRIMAAAIRAEGERK